MAPVMTSLAPSSRKNVYIYVYNKGGSDESVPEVPEVPEVEEPVEAVVPEVPETAKYLKMKLTEKCFTPKSEVDRKVS